MRLVSKGVLATMTCAGFAFPAVAGGGYTESFEYGNGGIAGIGGWEEWCGSSGVDGQVTDELAEDGTFSLRIDAGDDVVQRFNLTSGSFTLSVQTYMKSTGSGQAFVIGLNTYPDCNCTGVFNWSIQCRFDNDFGLITDDGSGQQITIGFDDWREIRFDIDLDADTMDISYEFAPDTFFTFVTGATYSDHVSGGGVAEFRCLDLFASSGQMYYDSVVVTAGGDDPCVSTCVADLVSGEITWGSNQGAVDVGKLETDDNDRVISKSRPFFSAIEPNLARLDVNANFACLGGGPGVTLDLQDNASQPGVTNRVQMTNVNTGQWENVGSYGVSFNVDADHQIVVADASNYIDGSGDIATRLKYSTLALLSPLGFDARTDLMTLTAE